MKKYLITILSLIFVLSAQVCFAADASGSIPRGTVNITGTHNITNNETLKTGRHTFVLTAKNGSPMPEGAKSGIKKVTISSNETFSFGDISYSQPGTYEYTLTREIAQTEDLKEDVSTYNIKIAIFSDYSATSIYEKDGGGGKTDKLVYNDTYICTLTFNLNGGNIDGDKGPITIEAPCNRVVTLLKAPEKKGYTFSYWKGSKYKAGAKYKVTGDHTFEAIYNKKGIGIPGTGDTDQALVLGLIIAAATFALYLNRKKRKTNDGR